MVWTKRAKFILVSIFLSLGLLSMQFIPFNFRYQAILVLTLLAAGISALALKEELVSIQWFICLILPSLYTGSVALFYFLLPERIILRILILVAFAVGMYAILLTENIFSVASGRTIQLLRAAQAVGYLMTLITVFFFYDTVFSFKLGPLSNFIFVFITSFPLYLQSVWSVNLDKKVTGDSILLTAALSILTGEAALMVSFWPLSLWLTSLFLVTYFYVIVGLTQHDLAGRLFAKTISEYLQVAVTVILVIIFLAKWRG